jgi:hypothetical protein
VCCRQSGERCAASSDCCGSGLCIFGACHL